MLIPLLYLKGISSGDFEEALAALVGKSLPLRRAGDAPGLSASTIARLKRLPSRKRGRCGPRSMRAGRSAICQQEIWMAQTKKDAVAALEAPVWS